MFSPRGAELERGWPGRVDGDRVVQLAAQTLEAFFTGGGGAREHAEYPLAEVELRPPVLRPQSVRVFSALERSDPPYFSFRNTGPVFGHGDDVPYPSGTDELDVGLALAAVVGADGAIGGVTLANDWTARDLERAERESGFGPSKSKDFALSIGPVLVTPDELAADGVVVTKVNGDERAHLDLERLAYGWEELVSHAGRNTLLRPGELLVCSAAAGGPPWVRPGDVVELHHAGIGVLRNRVARS
jgi:2-keto-4-pentenoate hydratase/2-oxohepta-3-ene-1,7-dioic acid hydratase in catechol pathway